MSQYGTMGVDWEQRIDFDRLRRERLDKAKRALAASDIDLMLVFRTEDSRYLTGFRSHLHPTASLGFAVSVLPKGGEPVLYTMDHEHCRARMPWLGADQVRPRANLREKAGVQKWVSGLRDMLGSVAGKKIGVDLWTPFMGQLLQEALPEAEFVDGYDVLMKAKITKTVDEIECLKMAASITEAAMDAAIEFLRPGVRECEVLAKAWEKMTALGSEWTQCANIVCSGPNTAPYRRFTSDRIIRNGDLVVIDIGACYNGYWGDFTRTWVCGDMRPTSEQKEIAQQCYDALFNSCAASIAGNTNADVYEAANGYVLDSLGHGSGVNPWEAPYFSGASKDSPVTLVPGMEFNLEPYSGRPGIGGVRLENCLVVTEGQPDIFTSYPFDARLIENIHPLDVSTARTQA